ncbi:MAG: hypothetical protein U0521_09775 [Anaerolineae bacterium]
MCSRCYGYAGTICRAPTWLPHLVAVLWIVITTISYLRWTAETWASQGRLVFGALSPILVLFALGLTWWLPRRVRPLLIGASGGVLRGGRHLRALRRDRARLCPARSGGIGDGASHVPRSRRRRGRPARRAHLDADRPARRVRSAGNRLADRSPRSAKTGAYSYI